MRGTRLLLLLSIMLFPARTVTSFTRVACSSYTKKIGMVRHNRSTKMSISTMNVIPQVSKEDMIALAQRVKEINDLNGMESVKKANFVPFRFDGLTYGYTSRSFANLLGGFPDVFTYDDNHEESMIKLTPSVLKLNLLDRSMAVGKVTAALRDQKIITGELIDSNSIFLYVSIRQI